MSTMYRHWTDLIKPKQLEVDEKTLTSTYGKFYAEPFERGFGQTIGNYEVKSKLGEGGMGSVYLAEHPLIGKKVALKVLHSEFSVFACGSAAPVHGASTPARA